MREIAAGAGVTAMLVNRYFGSKEQLFAEVIAATMARPTILTEENLQSPKLGRNHRATLVNITSAEDTPLEGFLIMLDSASSKRAAEIGRAQIEKGHQKTMTAAFSGDLAPQRAALVLSRCRRFPGDAADDRPLRAGQDGSCVTDRSTGGHAPATDRSVPNLARSLPQRAHVPGGIPSRGAIHCCWRISST